MPAPGMRWRHLILNTRCTWLHGDERGFRSRGHRIHSSGDYKDPPPPDEHEGLRRYHQTRSGEPVIIPAVARALAGPAFVARLRKEAVRCSRLQSRAGTCRRAPAMRGQDPDRRWGSGLGVSGEARGAENARKLHRQYSACVGRAPITPRADLATPRILTATPIPFKALSPAPGISAHVPPTLPRRRERPSSYFPVPYSCARRGVE